MSGRDDSNRTIVMSVGDKEFLISLEGNRTSDHFANVLPLTARMSDLNGNEKYLLLDDRLPTDATCPGTVHTGDLMLYGDDCLVVFYDTFGTRYRYTPVGKVMDVSGLAEALGDGPVDVVFSRTRNRRRLPHTTQRRDPGSTTEPQRGQYPDSPWSELSSSSSSSDGTDTSVSIGLTFP